MLAATEAAWRWQPHPEVWFLVLGVVALSLYVTRVIAPKVVPAGRGFAPDILLVSTGFDAHVDDPLASMEVTEAGFRELAERCASLAPRIAAVLEGGYNLETLPGLVAAAHEGFSV